MNTYLIGNLLGRLLVSYGLVWLVILLLSRFDWRAAFGKTRKWYGLLSIAALFTLGIAGGLSRGSL